MTDLKVREEQFGNEDHTWLRSAHGVDDGETIELDPSLFDEADHFPTGFLPSGLVVARVTATGRFGPYDDGAEDGREDAVYHLLFSKPVRADSDAILAAGVDHVRVDEAALDAKFTNLGAEHGLDAAAKADMPNNRYV